MKKNICLAMLITSATLLAQDFNTKLEDSEYRLLQKVCNISFEELQKALELFREREHVFSQSANGEYYFILPELVKKFNLQKGAEIGTLYAGHAAALLSTTNLKKLYCVDAYKGEHIGLSQGYADVLYYLTKKRLAFWDTRSKLIRDVSQMAALSFKKHELDFVFIDAGHTYEDVKSDLESWFEKVRPGGIVAGDDYTPMFPGVMKAVDEFFKDKKVIVHSSGTNNRAWWVQKD